MDNVIVERASATPEHRERATVRGRGATDMPAHVAASIKRANHTPADFFREQRDRDLAEAEAFISDTDARMATRQQDAARRAGLDDPAVRRRQVADAEAFARSVAASAARLELERERLARGRTW